MVTTTRQLQHVTLNTGHSRLSPRSEVAEDVLIKAAEIVQDALTYGSSPLLAGYELRRVTIGEDGCAAWEIAPAAGSRLRPRRRQMAGGCREVPGLGDHRQAQHVTPRRGVISPCRAVTPGGLQIRTTWPPDGQFRADRPEVEPLRAVLSTSKRPGIGNRTGTPASVRLSEPRHAQRPYQAIDRSRHAVQVVNADTRPPASSTSRDRAPAQLPAVAGCGGTERSEQWQCACALTLASAHPWMVTRADLLLRKLRPPGYLRVPPGHSPPAAAEATIRTLPRWSHA